MKSWNIPRASLIVSTYNRPDALYLCLLSIRQQKTLPHEVIIGDDGSTDETRILIEELQKDFPIPLIHVWQEDKGFRKTIILNKAVAKSTGEYIIEIDGDLILHPKFIEDHLKLAKKGHFLRGGRTRLNKDYTEKICKIGKLPHLNFFSLGLGNRMNTIRLPFINKYLSARYKKNKKGGLGCNLSFWKEDFININGYDEFFVGWGSEDYEFICRLSNNGVVPLRLKFSGITYHLWHAEANRYNKERNSIYFKKKDSKKILWNENGVDKYLVG